MRRAIFYIILSLITIIDISGQNSFVSVKNGRFYLGDKPYPKYIGANFWYGAMLASEGQGGDRIRLKKELDFLDALGVKNLRVLVGSDGSPLNRPTSYKANLVYPTLQTSPGEYNDTILAGLDYLLMEMGKRDMKAVLYLNNAWEWSGGYGQYLEWSGAGPTPQPNIDGYDAYMKHVAQFSTNKTAQRLFFNHVRFIISRTNRYTGIAYKNDPCIMSWQIGNEPRAFNPDYSKDSRRHKAAFASWLSKTSHLIKKLDKNHMVTTGSEGRHGCEEDPELFRIIHADKNIDYICIHIWPYNWGWMTENQLKQSGSRIDVSAVNDSTGNYIDEALGVAMRMNKPIVIEEFGFPRDGFSTSKTSTTNGRDNYYDYLFSAVCNPAYPLLAGCNFWGWGGFAEPAHTSWLPYDQYTGDPAQEAQGLNSVFSSDGSTIEIIKKHTGVNHK